MIRQSVCKRLDKVSRLPTQKAKVVCLNFDNVDGLSDDGIGCCCTTKGLGTFYGEHSLYIWSIHPSDFERTQIYICKRLQGNTGLYAEPSQETQ